MNEKITIEGKRPATATAQEAIRLRDKEGMTLEAIGNQWGITRQRVGKIIKDFLSKQAADAKR